MKPHNVLIVGAGKIGSIRASVIKKLSPRSKIFIFDTNFKKAEALAKEAGGIALKSLREGLSNNSIDIVIVSVINKFSKNISVLALKNKKHVLCEKPMGINFKEANDIQTAAKLYKRKFKCGFNHRYHGAIQEAFKLCKKNQIGKILYIRGVYGHGGRKGYEKEWRAKKSLSGGGELLDQGCHLIDLCHWFFGFEKVKNIYGIAKPLFWKMKVDDNAFVVFETESGKVAHLHATWTQWKNLFKFEIYGTKGALEINGLGKSYGIETLKIYKRHKLGKPPEIIEQEFKGNDNSWEHEWMDFILAIESKNSKVLPMSNENESLEVMRTISKIYKH
ncbi:MAG: Gfo/Idh/MocA family oxidoreductase [bacterium]|nr:Gfo/Idh/MocA family oxidoreductase [bacterium]